MTPTFLAIFVGLICLLVNQVMLSEEGPEHHHGEELAPGAVKTPQPGKKTAMENHVSDEPKIAAEAGPIPTNDKPLI